MEVSQKTEIELLYDPAIPLLGKYIQKKKREREREKTLIQKDNCTQNFIPALFTIAKIWKSTDEWVKKMWYIYNAIMFGHKKEQNVAICSNIGEPGGPKSIF